MTGDAVGKAGSDAAQGHNPAEERSCFTRHGKLNSSLSDRLMYLADGTTHGVMGEGIGCFLTL
ncbi:unannotated protein [freshwater metagenome]|uniref:Unannotated protein n=1 Tax=freshwater metagenome TaxID=449393 RepID=A0A6J6HCC1_9ZZZZ